MKFCSVKFFLCLVDTAFIVASLSTDYDQPTYHQDSNDQKEKENDVDYFNEEISLVPISNVVFTGEGPKLIDHYENIPDKEIIKNSRKYFKNKLLKRCVFTKFVSSSDNTSKIPLKKRDPILHTLSTKKLTSKKSNLVSRKPLNLVKRRNIPNYQYNTFLEYELSPDELEENRSNLDENLVYYEDLHESSHHTTITVTRHQRTTTPLFSNSNNRVPRNIKKVNKDYSGKPGDYNKLVRFLLKNQSIQKIQRRPGRKKYSLKWEIQRWFISNFENDFKTFEEDKFMVLLDTRFNRDTKLRLTNILYKVNYYTNATCTTYVIRMIELVLPQQIEMDICKINDYSNFCYITMKNSSCFKNNKVHGTKVILNYYLSLAPIIQSLAKLEDKLVPIKLMLALNKSIETAFTIPVEIDSNTQLIPDGRNISRLYLLGCAAEFSLNKNESCERCKRGTYSQEGSALCDTILVIHFHREPSKLAIFAVSLLVLLLLLCLCIMWRAD